MDSPDLTAALGPLIAEPGRSAILLDLDGTLAPIVPNPDGVAIDATIRGALPVLRDRYALLAFVSGRSLSDLRRIVRMDGVVYSGNHGQEIVDRDGAPVPTPAVDLDSLHEFAARWDPASLKRLGIWLEDKHQTLTFHYRNATDPDEAERYLSDAVAPVGVAAGLRVAPGRMSLEVHPGGSTSKGTAARAILEAHPHVARAVSLGDDRTDVDLWRVLGELRTAGRLESGVGIGVLSDETPDVVREGAHLTVQGIAGSARVLDLLAGPAITSGVEAPHAARS